MNLLNEWALYCAEYVESGELLYLQHYRGQRTSRLSYLCDRIQHHHIWVPLLQLHEIMQDLLSCAHGMAAILPPAIAFGIPPTQLNLKLAVHAE